MAESRSTAAPHFETVCERVENGEFTRPVLRELGITKHAFYDYVNADPERQKRYQEAKDDGEEEVLLEGLRIVDNTDEDPASRRVRSEFRLKALAKFNPKRWGERMALDHGGTLRVGAAPELTDEELARIAAGGSEGAAVPALGSE
jgi:hypothetical protein